MPFSQKNPFNADANFTSIKFGVNKPVLEVELNEMQSILRNHSKDSIKELFGDGVVGKGQYTYTSNKFTLANEVAILDGEVIKVDSISINANNEDTIYLQSAIELKAYTDSIKKYGNSASATTVTNTIKDSRVNMETSRREQLVYNLATTVNGAKNNLKLGTIKNGTFVLDCPVLNQNIVNETVEGSYITVENTKDGAITDIEILGNTVQDSSNLADIKSVGIAREDGNFEIELKSCGKNLFNKDDILQDTILAIDGNFMSNKGSATSKKIKAKPNTKYTLKGGDRSIFRFEDVNGKLLGSQNASTVTTPNNCYYLYVYPKFASTVNLDDIQLEEGTVTTTYEQPQVTTSKIILPCQLEKVGDIKDRLFRREDGVWCIEKNIGEVVLNGNENWVLYGTQPTDTNLIAFRLHSVVGGYGICNKFNIVNINTQEGITFGGSYIYITISKTKLSTQDVAGFKTWLSQNLTLVKYQLATPEIIELPLDTQISLNSFFGTTNVFIESGEVEGTIKCTISKSLGGSIKSLVSKADSIEERVEKIENLQKGNEMQVSTNKKSVVVEDTNEGYVTDFNIKGETLVNLAKVTKRSTIETLWAYLDIEVLKVSTNTLYTVIPLNIPNGYTYKLTNQDATQTYVDYGAKNTFTLNEIPSYFKLHVNDRGSNNVTVSQINDVEVLILEGDHTDKDLPYFEGLKSVGDGVDKIELISNNNGNYAKYIGREGSSYSLTIQENELIGNTNNLYGEVLKVKPNTQYTIKFNENPLVNKQLRIYGYTHEPQFTAHSLYPTSQIMLETNVVGNYEITFTTNSNINYILVGTYNETSFNLNYYVNGSIRKTQNKELLYKNNEGLYEKPVLRRVSDTIYDSIELHSDGKYYYHKRCGEVILKGVESWIVDLNRVNTLKLRTTIDNSIQQVSHVKCDKFMDRYGILDDDFEYVGKLANSTTFYLSIAKTKLNSENADGVKTWLSQNPTTVVYPLATEEVYECTNIDLNAYNDTTFISLESGFISPQYSAKVSKHIGNVVNQIKEKTDTLEEKVGKLLDERTKGYSTDKGYVVAKDTTDSYIENVKVEGNTLVANFSLSAKTQKYVDYNRYSLGEIKGLKANCKYTIIIPKLTTNVTTDLHVYLAGKSNKVNPKALVTSGKDNYFVTLVESGEDISNTKFETSVSVTCTLDFENLLLIEGDHTNNPPSYFEGLLSTGQDVEAMNIMSCGKNLFNKNNVQLNSILQPTGEIIGNNPGYGVSDFIRVIPGETLIKSNSINSTGLYDINKQFVTRTTASQGAFTIGDNIHYIRSNFDMDKVDKFQIERGSIATEYAPYIERKKPLLYKNSEGEFVPIPALRRVPNGIRDTIELHTDGKYYYHKRCEEMKLDGSENWTSYGGGTREQTLNFNTLLTPTGANVSNRSELVCDTFPYGGLLGWDSDFDNITTSQDRVYIAISKSKLPTQDVNGFKQWLFNNNVTFIYPLLTEEVYECNNLDLNSYDRETLVQIESGAISPAKISFKHSTHIGNIVTKMKEDVDKNTKFREEMTESVTYKKTFDTGYEVFEDTKEGSTTIDKIEGNTLVNLCPQITQRYNDCNISSEKGFTVISSMQGFVGSLMLRVVKNDTPKYIDIHYGDGYKVQYFNPTDYPLVTRVYFENTAPTDYSKIKVLILEGDHTQNPPSYFEGLKSVGEGVDKIEIFSQDKNVKKEGYNITNFICTFPTLGITTGSTAKTLVIKISPNTVYTIKRKIGKSFRVFTTSSYPIAGGYANQTIANHTGDEIIISCKDNDNYLCIYYYDYTDTVNHEEILSSIYISTKQNKKQILYQTKEGNYEKPILRSTGEVSDTIEKHSDGKYYYHRRCGEGLINGTEYWMIGVSTQFTDTHMYFATNHFDSKMQAGLCLANTLPQGRTWNKESVEGIDGANTSDILRVRIAKSKLTQQNDVGFKEWLTKNPTTFIYPLKVEEVYECVNLDLDSYEGETSIFLPSTIPAKITASVSSNLRQTLENMKDRINYLEDKVMNMFKSVLSGDVQTLAYMLYPEDFKEEDHPTTLEEPPIIDDVIEGVMPLALEVEEEQPKKKTRTRKKTTKKSE